MGRAQEADASLLPAPARARRGAAATRRGCGSAPGRPARRSGELGLELEAPLLLGRRPDLRRDERLVAGATPGPPSTSSARPYIGEESKRRARARTRPRRPRSATSWRSGPRSKVSQVPSPTTGTSTPVFPRLRRSILWVAMPATSLLEAPELAAERIDARGVRRKLPGRLGTRAARARGRICRRSTASPAWSTISATRRTETAWCSSTSSSASSKGRRAPRSCAACTRRSRRAGFPSSRSVV